MPAPPQVGQVVNGYTYQGGDPKQPASWQQLTGQDYLKTLPPDRQAQVKELLVGKMKYPSLSRNNAFGQALLRDASLVDPNFDQNVYKLRSDTYHDFANGKTAQLIQALNQAPLHALTLADAYDKLHNSDYGGHTMNDFVTKAEAAGLAFGDARERMQAGMGKFNEAQPAVADELATLYKGGPATIPGIESQERAFPMGAAPTESNSALATASELMHDRLNTLQTKWHNAMGPMADQFPVISPQAQAALVKLYGRYHPAAHQPAAQVGGWSIQKLP